MGADSIGSAAYTSYRVPHPSLCCSCLYFNASITLVHSINVKQTDILPFSLCLCLNYLLFGVPVIAVMLTYIGNTQAGLLPGLPAVHIRGKLFTILFLLFLFNMQNSFLPYNAAYLAVLTLLLC